MKLKEMALLVMPAIVTLGGFSGCSETDHLTAPLQRGVTGVLPSVAVVRRSVRREIGFDGVVEAVGRSTVAAQTGGRVMELPFDVGDNVQPGAEIVRLTSAEQGARVEAANSAVNEARARLSEAKLAFARAQQIYAQKLIPKAQFDAAGADLKAVQARFESAKANLTQAHEALKYTVIRAPFGGIVLERHVQIGETVAPGTPLMTGVSLQQLRVAVEIPQQHMAPLRAHQQARVLLADGHSLAVDKLRIPPAADPSTHTFRVRLELPPGDHGIFPGTLAKVVFMTGEDERTVIPAQAVVRRGELTGAYVVSDKGLITLRYLRLGMPLPDGDVPVQAGLAAGEQVAADTIAAAIAYKQQKVTVQAERHE